MKTVETIKTMIATEGAPAYRAHRDELRDAVSFLCNRYEVDRLGAVEQTPAHTVTAWAAQVGYTRAAVVLASLVNRSAWDGRISREVKAWAAGVADAYDEEAAERLCLSCDTIHKAHLDQIAAAFMKLTPADVEAAQEAEKATESENPTEDTTNTESGAEAAENEKGADTMTTNTTNPTSPAAQLFPRLYAEIGANYERRTADTFHYIRLGWFPSWAAEHHDNPDRGLKQYSTPRRWEQYQAGEITREKAVELAERRAAKEIEKSRAAKLEQLEAAAIAPRMSSASVCVTWAKSRTWGANPTAELLNVGDRRTVGHASGCGYDKESAAVAEAMNANPAALRVLYELGESALARGDSPRSKSACSGYHWGGCIGYGAGYDVLPYWEGGVGVSCFWSILKTAGYSVRCAGSGKMFDCYTIERAESATA